MAEQTTQPPNELDRAAEEAGFYHEAALNAAWTGSRFAVGGLAFLYGRFAFAYFYLRSINSSGRWKGSGFHAPQMGYGVTILVLVLLSAVVQYVGLQRIKAGAKGAWQAAALVALLLGLAAVALQIVQLLIPAVPARQFRLLQRVHRHLPGPAGQLARGDALAGDPGHARPAAHQPFPSSSSRPPTPRRSRCSGSSRRSARSR